MVSAPVEVVKRSPDPGNGRPGASPRLVALDRAPARRPRGGLDLSLSQSQASVFSGHGQQRARWGIERYRDTVWAYGAISQVASDIASLPWQIRRGPKPQDPHVERGKLLDLLTRPNPRMTLAELLEAVVIYLESAGRAPLLMASAGGVESRGPVDALIPLRPDWVIPVPDSSGFAISHYVYRPPFGAGGEREFPATAVAEFAYFDPLDPIGGGLSPLVPAMLAIEQWHEAMRFNSRFFKQGASVGFIASTKIRLEDAEYERFQKQIDEHFTGARNAHRFLLLDDFEGEITPLQVTHRDMGFIELLKVARRDILTALNVPPAIAGEFEALNRAQVDMQAETYWTKKMIPLTRRIEAVINQAIAARVEPGMFFHFDLSEVKVLQEDQTAILDRQTKRIQFGLATPNEILDEDGRPTYTDGDRHYIHASLVPVDSTSSPAPAIGMGGPGAGEAAPGPARERVSAPASVEREGGTGAAVAREIERAAAWRGFAAQLRVAEAELGELWQRELDRLATAVVRRVRAHPPVLRQGDLTIGLPDDVATYLPDADRLVREITARHGRLWVAIVARFGEAAVEAVAAELVFDARTPAVLTLVERDEARVGEEVIRLLDGIRDVLEDGLAEGESIGALVGRIRTTVGGSPKTPARGGPTVRSQRIARTEALAAANSGAVEGYRQVGIEAHEWLSSRDAFVRDSHREADGQRRWLGEPFEIEGSQLLFPGDPAGPPELIINCRCTTVPAISQGLAESP